MSNSEQREIYSCSEMYIDMGQTTWQFDGLQSRRNSMRESCTDFYIDLEESCKRRAAKEVSELKTIEELNAGINEEQDLSRIPNFLVKGDNFNRVEQYLSEHYKEAIYQELWESAQTAVFHGTHSCSLDGREVRQT